MTDPWWAEGIWLQAAEDERRRRQMEAAVREGPGPEDLTEDDIKRGLALAELFGWP